MFFYKKMESQTLSQSKISRKRSKAHEIDEFIRSLYGSDTQSDEDLRESHLKKQVKEIVHGLKTKNQEVPIPTEPAKDIPHKKVTFFSFFFSFQGN